jgi:hypothetical protein
VEYTDNSLDLIVENLTLSGRHLLPNVVEVEAHNYLRFSPYEPKSAGDAGRHEFTFTFAQMHADMRAVAFSFRTKTGPIKMQDSGLADVLLGGQGLTVRLLLCPALPAMHWMLMCDAPGYGYAHVVERHALSVQRRARARQCRLAQV